MTEGPRDLDIERAKHALDKVNSVKDDSSSEKFRSYVERLPATIVMNGLGQAMAMELYQSNKDEGKSDAQAHELLHDIVEEWLNKTVYGSGDLMENITENDQEKYIKAQREALAYLVWLKKFSKAFIEKGG